MGATDITILPARSVIVPTTIFQSGTVSDVPIIVRGIAGQTGDLIQFQDSTGATILRVTPEGVMRTGSDIDYTQQFLFGGQL